MPNIKPNAIVKLERLMRNNNCDVGTLASNIIDKNDVIDPNIVKVHLDQILKENSFLNVKDFFRLKEAIDKQIIYHHIGIYAFTNIALTKYVKLAKSKLEIERNLEQMRAMENNLVVKVGLSDSQPLSVDTEKDLQKVIKEMN
jgi:3-deoxy-manno-octulosonate cytidylyltransferase (CMP-KDO synthetase)